MAQKRRPENQNRRTDSRDNRIVQYDDVRYAGKKRAQHNTGRSRSGQSVGAVRSNRDVGTGGTRQSRGAVPPRQNVWQEQGSDGVRRSAGQGRGTAKSNRSVGREQLRQSGTVKSNRSVGREQLQQSGTVKSNRSVGREQLQQSGAAKFNRTGGQNQPQRKSSQNRNAAYRKAGTAGYRQQGKKRRRKKRRINWKRIGIAACILVAVGFLGYLETILFQTKEIVVAGNQYVTDAEVTEWLRNDKYANNSLYVLWKYNRGGVKQLPAVENVRVELKSPQKILVQVKEKTFSGRMDFQGRSLYFDREGIASLQTESIIEGVTYVSGIDIAADKVVMGKILPVKEKKVFRNINDVTAKLKEYELTPDKISCEGGGLSLYFGNFKIQTGSGGYAQKLAQIPPILAKLNELYADQTGTLHLENYEKEDTSIRFVPGPIEDPANAAEPAAEGQDAGEPAAEGQDTADLSVEPDENGV